MTLVSQRQKRTGVVYRIMQHGTVMVRDNATGRSFPYYSGEDETLAVGDHMMFVTDRNDTFITRFWSLKKTS